MRILTAILLMLSTVSCTNHHGRLIPPTGVWRYYDSSLLHAQALEVDLFSDGSFSLRDSGGDSKTMTRSYTLLMTGSYSISSNGTTITLTLDTPTKEGTKELKGTLDGKRMTLELLGSAKSFQWRSPS